MDIYHQECLDFLSTVEQRADEEERLRDAVAPNENIINDDESTESVVDLTSTGTSTRATGKAQQFRWKYAMVKEKSFGLKNKTKTVNAFLNDNNLQDLYFSEAVIAVAPYLAKDDKETQSRYNTIVKNLIQKVYSNGTIPFQQLTDVSAKSRVMEYMSLAEQWNSSDDDMTGAVFHDGTSPDEYMYEKGYFKMTVKEKIMYNVENIIDEYACMKL